MGKRRSYCRPPAGHTYLTIGQDMYSIQEYVNEMYNYSLHEYMKKVNQTHHNNKTVPRIPQLSSILPAAFMVYTDLQTLKGLDEPTDYGSGIEYADGSLALSGGGNAVGVEGLQVGLWLAGSTGCQDLLDGLLDSQLHRLYHYIAHSPYDVIWLRIGYEVDNFDFGYSDRPLVFQKAYQTLVEGCRKYKDERCRDKAIFVWHSWAAGLPGSTTLEDIYPGNNYVDWVGISLFQQFYGNELGGNLATVQQVLDFASSHDKPVIIAESTPFGGFHELSDPWNDWFAPVLDLIESNDNIQMWSYINCDWDSQPMWHNIGFGETRLSQNLTVLQLWNERVLKNPRFLLATDGPLCSVHDKHSELPNLLASSWLPWTHSEGQGFGDFVLHYWYAKLLFVGLVLIWCGRFWILSDRNIYGRYDYQDLSHNETEDEIDEVAMSEENRQTEYGSL